MVTERHTPRFWGLLSRMGLSDLNTGFSRPLRISWLIVGIVTLPPFRVVLPTQINFIAGRSLFYVPHTPFRQKSAQRNISAHFSVYAYVFYHIRAFSVNCFDSGFCRATLFLHFIQIFSYGIDILFVLLYPRTDERCVVRYVQAKRRIRFLLDTFYNRYEYGFTEFVMIRRYYQR